MKLMEMKLKELRESHSKTLSETVSGEPKVVENCEGLAGKLAKA